MKSRRTLAAINTKAISIGLQTNRAKQKTWTKKDYKILKEVSKLSDELKLPIEKTVAIYNLISGKNRSAFSVGERINMIKDPNYKVNTERKKPTKDIRPIRCIETGQIFESVKAANEFYGKKQTNISAVCRGERSIALGYHWKYIDEQEENAESHSDIEGDTQNVKRQNVKD